MWSKLKRGRVSLSVTARIVLLAAAFAAVRFTPLYEQFLGQVMLFTQRSPQTLAGALRSSQAAPLYALQLAVFRAVILPWSRPALTVADTLVFGTVPGLLLAWAGNAAADSACFALSRLLFGRAAARRLPERARALVLGWGGSATCAALLILPWAGGFAGYLMGLSPLPWQRWLTGAACGELFSALAYGLFGSRYAAAIPSRMLYGMRALAALLLLCTLAHQLYRRNHHS